MNTTTSILKTPPPVPKPAGFKPGQLVAVDKGPAFIVLVSGGGVDSFAGTIVWASQPECQPIGKWSAGWDVAKFMPCPAGTIIELIAE